MVQVYIVVVFNKFGYDFVDNYIYVFFGDGCLMEGVFFEVCFFVGYFQFGNFIVVWDDNYIIIDGDINQVFIEDVFKRYEFYGWYIIIVEDGDNDFEGIFYVFKKVQEVKDKFMFIQFKIIIGFGFKQQGIYGVYGVFFKVDDIKQFKEKFGFDFEKSFDVFQEVYDYCCKVFNVGVVVEEEWNKLFVKYFEEYKGEVVDFVCCQKGDFFEGWEKNFFVYIFVDVVVVFRKFFEIVINKIFDVVFEFVGGFVDLIGFNFICFKGLIDFQFLVIGFGIYDGCYICYGVCEYGMGVIMNGFVVYGIIILYGGIFFNFVFYVVGVVCFFVLFQVCVIWVVIYDFIGFGEDGFIYQFIEVFIYFCVFFNCMVWCFVDGNEMLVVYYVVFIFKYIFSIIVFFCQNFFQLEGFIIEKVIKGGYVFYEQEGVDIIFVFIGFEVCIVIDVVKFFVEKYSIKVCVVFFFCFEVFDIQLKDYQFSVFFDGIFFLFIEVMFIMGWEKYIYEQFGLNCFGVLGFYKDVYVKFEFIFEGVVKCVFQIIDFWKGVFVCLFINCVFQQIF